LGAAALLAVLYAGLCKALLFHNLEYYGSDLYSFLEMSRGWHYGGGLLRDNVWGDHTAIHNFYLLLAFSPLTIAFGAYGLFLGLVLLDLVAVLRAATAPSLAWWGRLAVLAGFLSPVAFFIFDHRRWGFHPELTYPPLALLLALEIAGGRWKRALLVGTLVVLVKEDGAVVCASLLLAYFAGRLVDLRNGPADERRKVLVLALQSLAAVTVVFAVGMAILFAAGRTVAAPQATAGPRILDSLRILGQTLTGEDSFARWRLGRGLVGYALVAGLLLLPLGRRFFRGLFLILVSAAPLVVVLVVSAGGYGSGTMLWPPRLATFLALVVGCLVFVSATPAGASTSLTAEPPPAGRAAATTAALALVSWGLQLPLLAGVGYSPWPRLHVWALLGERGYRLAQLPKHEVRFVRCLAEGLPAGLRVAEAGDHNPFFHRQSIVFGTPGAPGGPPARLRLVSSSEATAATREGTSCLGPRVGGLAVEADCDLLPRIADCDRLD
jgi:hypothetical protein